MTAEKNEKSFIKNVEDYQFSLNSLGELSTENKPTLKLSDDSIHIFLNGIIYNKNEEELLEGFKQKGTSFVKELEGSFIIFLIINEEFIVLTDSFNSKKAYYLVEDESNIISTDIDHLTIINDKLSIDGISSYISNGSLLNNLTIFENVKSFPRASINRFLNNTLKSHLYNKYEFNYDLDVNQDLLKEELQDLILDSINKRFKTCEQTALSLSAGWDARGILGVLGESMQARNLSSFSYAKHEIPKPNTDGYIARNLALRYGYKHNMIKSYNGDIINLINNNAKHGKGISYFCYEIDAWLSLQEKNKYSDIFVGDEIFGWQDTPLHNKENVLDSIIIRRSPSIKWLKKYIPNDTFHAISISVDNSLDVLYEKASEIDNLHDKKDFLYLEHRISNVMMPWRELMSSKAGFVHNPFLDEKIFEFMKKVPPALRKDKKLFKLAINDLYPELFSIPKATDPGHLENWANEVNSAKENLIEIIMTTDSLLDSIIPKESVIKLIKLQDSKIDKLKNFTIRGINYLRKRIGNADKYLTKLIGARNPNTDSVTVLLRILYLRTYLTRKQKDTDINITNSK